MRLLLLTASVLAFSTVQAQGLEIHEGSICTLYDVGGEAVSGPPLDTEVLAATARQKAGASAGQATYVTTEGGRATIVVKYNPGFTAEALVAFQAAVDIWANHVASPVTIRVEASFSPLGTGVLGSAGPRLTANFPGAPNFNTWYPWALADAYSRRDIFPPVDDNPSTQGDESDYRADIEATFNSEFPSFYYGADGNPPSGQYDFRTIVLHELGHGLGFVGSGDYDDGIDATGSGRDTECDGIEGHGCWGFQSSGAVPQTYPIVFDLTVEDRAGVSMLNTSKYPQNSAALGTLLTSNGTSPDPANKELFADGAAIRAVNADQRAPLYAPRPAQPGSSISHWDEYVYARGTSSALMTPRLAPQEVYTNPGPLTCALFSDMGWALGPGCEALFPTPDEAAPLATAPGLERTGPNPFETATSFRLSVARESNVQITLVDVLGRTVRTLYAGPAGPRGVEVTVEGAGLAPGLYLVRVEGDGTAFAAPIVRR